MGNQHMYNPCNPCLPVPPPSTPKFHVPAASISSYTQRQQDFLGEVQTHRRAGVDVLATGSPGAWAHGGSRARGSSPAWSCSGQVLDSSSSDLGIIIQDGLQEHLKEA